MIELALLIIGLVIGILLGWLWLDELLPTGEKHDPALQAELDGAKAGLAAKSRELERAERRAGDAEQRAARLADAEQELEALRKEHTARTAVGGNGSATPTEDALSEKDARIVELERSLAECRKRAATPAISEMAPGVKIAGVAAPAEGVRDDLKEIKGVGPVLEKVLNDYGIVTFRQLAELDSAGVASVEEEMTEFPGRITRDDWVAQAAELHEKHHG